MSQNKIADNYEGQYISEYYYYILNKSAEKLQTLKCFSTDQNDFTHTALDRSVLLTKLKKPKDNVPYTQHVWLGDVL